MVWHQSNASPSQRTSSTACSIAFQCMKKSAKIRMKAFASWNLPHRALQFEGFTFLSDATSTSHRTICDNAIIIEHDSNFKRQMSSFTHFIHQRLLVSQPTSPPRSNLKQLHTHTTRHCLIIAFVGVDTPISSNRVSSRGMQLKMFQQMIRQSKQPRATKAQTVKRRVQWGRGESNLECNASEATITYLQHTLHSSWQRHWKTPLFRHTTAVSQAQYSSQLQLSVSWATTYSCQLGHHIQLSVGPPIAAVSWTIWTQVC